MRGDERRTDEDLRPRFSNSMMMERLRVKRSCEALGRFVAKMH